MVHSNDPNPAGRPWRDLASEPEHWPSLMGDGETARMDGSDPIDHAADVLERATRERGSRSVAAVAEKIATHLAPRIRQRVVMEAEKLRQQREAERPGGQPGLFE